MKTNSKSGTLVLYDSENMTTPVRPDHSHYIIDKIDVLLLREMIEKEFPSLGIDFVFFGKRLSDQDVRGLKIQSFFKFLYSTGFDIVSKFVSRKQRFIKLQTGETVLYHYEKCDLDTEMVDMIHKNAHLYEHIILVSGDDDMLPALLRARDNFGTRITAISHRESMSNSFSQIENLYIDELLSRKGK